MHGPSFAGSGLRAPALSAHPQPAHPEASKGRNQQRPRRLIRLRRRSRSGSREFLLATTFLLALALLLVTGSSLLATPTHAQSAPTVTDGGVEAKFPDRLAFRASAQSASEIQKVRFRYQILPDGDAASGEADFQPGTSISALFALQAADQPTFYLPPGTTIKYHWEVTDAAGNIGRTDEATFFYTDDRFQWSSLDQGGVTIYYYAGSENDARDMLDVAATNIARMSGVLGATVDFPVKVWIYDSVDDMRPALPRRSVTFEGSVITAGIRVTTDTVLVLGEASFDTLRHELTHVVTAVAGESALGTLPAWLDEGTAVYSQEDPGGFKNAVDSAIDRGNVLSVRSITSSPGDPDKVNLFYGEAWSLVSYLNEKYGQEKFAQLFATIKSGKRIDNALKAVYGFDQDGLEDEWRAANGLPPRETPQATQKTASPRDSGAAGQSPSGNSSGSDGGTSTTTVIIIAVATLLLAALIALAGFTLARRFK